MTEGSQPHNEQSDAAVDPVPEKQAQPETGASAEAPRTPQGEGSPGASPSGADESQPGSETPSTERADRPVEVEDPVQQIEQLRSELEQMKDRALRAQAELENYRKRVARQREQEQRYAELPLIRDLLPVFDDVHRAIAAAEGAEGTEGLLQGFKLVAEKLEQVLQRHHCTRIEAEGKPFDPNIHEAIAQVPTAECPPNTVVQVAQVGFRLHDRVVRPSQVVVSTAPSSQQESADGNRPPEARDSTAEGKSPTDQPNQ